MVAWAVATWEAVMWAAASRVELAAGAVTLTTPAEAMRAIAAAVIVAGEELPGAVTTGMVAAGMDEGGTVVGGTAIAGAGMGISVLGLGRRLVSRMELGLLRRRRLR